MIDSRNLSAQASINAGNSPPDPSAMLDVKSADRGLLPPRMTYAEINAIPNPAAGLMVYCTNCGEGGTGAMALFRDGMWFTLDALRTSPGVPCPGTPSVTYGGKTYNTVLIGTQCWLGANLDIGTRINGNSDQADNQVVEKYCYNDLAANCTVYGGLYQWNEMMQYSASPGARGICPEGWHIPTDLAWTTLADFLGGQNGAGSLLKETGTAHWAVPNTGATNSTGFTALPAGERADPTSFVSIAATTTYWASSTDTQLWGLYRSLNNYSGNLTRYSSPKISGFSVRCLKN